MVYIGDIANAIRGVRDFEMSLWGGISGGAWDYAGGVIFSNIPVVAGHSYWFNVAVSDATTFIGEVKDTTLGTKQVLYTSVVGGDSAYWYEGTSVVLNARMAWAYQGSNVYPYWLKHTTDQWTNPQAHNPTNGLWTPMGAEVTTQYDMWNKAHTIETDFWSPWSSNNSYGQWYHCGSIDTYP
jgi:hypothetical protein